MTIKLDKTLYKLHSTKQIGSWRIFVVDGEEYPLIVREACKVLGGLPVKTITKVPLGKNIGKANETTPLEQALSEANSKISKQYDKGYVDEMPNVTDEVTNSLGFKQPMLAKPIEKVKNWKFPVYAQPKFDGHRMLATVENNKVVMYSRQGKEISAEHIAEQLQKAFDDGHWSGETLDGEIYCHGLTLQAISSLVKRPQEESKQLTYNIYDKMVSEEYSERLDIIENIVYRVQHTSVQKVATFFVESEEELNTLHAKFLSDGYEGTIVRHGSTGYENGKRSASLMKKKDFQDAEYQVIGWKLGKPDIRETETFERPVFLCVTKDGKEFEATAPGTMQERHAMFEAGLDNFIGKMLTVKYFNYTPDGAPFLPVALRFREDV